MLGILAWNMKITFGGVPPLTNHDLQRVDAQRSPLAGKPLGFSGGLFQAKGDWARYQQIFGFSILEWHSEMLEMQRQIC